MEMDMDMEMETENTNDVIYRECLRNHAASLGSYATDGCGEFTLDDSSPGCLQCAACGCHRNFHRKVTYVATHVRGGGGGASYSSRGGRREGPETTAELMDYTGAGRQAVMLDSGEAGERNFSKKRFRTKFTQDQKEKMLAFAEKLEWKLQRKDLDDEIERFCRGVGVSRQVFKVWMHNHKNASSSSSASTGNASSLTQ